jgi:transcriptional regulator GlxA family with amidase domain
MNRRDFAEAAAAFAAAISAGAFHAGPAAAEPSAAFDHEMPASWYGREKLAFLIYPGMTSMDMIGPHFMLTSLIGATTQLVAKTKEPVKDATGLVFLPDADFASAVSDVDVFCVPGGTTGTLDAMKDEATLAFVKNVGGKAKFVTSVCTGSLILGAAGLLDGYEATSHWVAKSLLPIFGAKPAAGRFVRDRNRITAEGVTAGLDMGLSMLAEFRDREFAESVQLVAQYAPRPVFNAGDPSTAPKAVKENMEHMFVKFIQEAGKTGIEAFERSKSL